MARMQRGQSVMGQSYLFVFAVQEQDQRLVGQQVLAPNCYTFTGHFILDDRCELGLCTVTF